MYYSNIRRIDSYIEALNSVQRSGFSFSDTNCTINEQTVAASLSLVGDTATVSSWDTFSIGTGTTYPEVIQPVYSRLDKAVKYNGSRAHVAADRTVAEITTEDSYFRMLIKTPRIDQTASNHYILYKKSSATGYYCWFETSTQRIRFGALNATLVSSAALEFDTWYRVDIFHDRSGYSQIYVNSVESGSRADISSRTATWEADYSMRVGGPTNSLHVAQLQIFMKDNWFSTDQVLSSVWSMSSSTISTHTVVAFTSSDIVARLTSASAYTLRDLTYKGVTIVDNTGSNGLVVGLTTGIIGAGHGGEVITRSVLMANNESYPYAVGDTSSGDRVFWRKESTIGMFEHEAEIIFPDSGDYIEERHKLKVVSALTDFSYIYALMHCTANSMNAYLVIDGDDNESSGSINLDDDSTISIFSGLVLKAVIMWDSVNEIGVCYSSIDMPVRQVLCGIEA